MEVTAKNFDSVVNNNGTVLVDFWADWCGPCKLQAPIIDELEDKYQGKFTVVKLNVDDEPSIAQRYSVTNIPTLVVCSAGKEISRAVGLQTLDQLEIMLGQA